MNLGESNRHYASAQVRDAVPRQKARLRELGWIEAPGDRWINPRTKRITSFEGALDRESISSALNRLRNSLSRERRRNKEKRGRGRPEGIHTSPVRGPRFDGCLA